MSLIYIVMSKRWGYQGAPMNDICNADVSLDDSSDEMSGTVAVRKEKKIKEK